MWTSRSQVDLMTNSNLFSEFLSLYCINRYVGQKTSLNSYVARLLDKDRKPRYRIPLIEIYNLFYFINRYIKVNG